MNNQKGFTLIELMIVIAIIGILMGTTFKLMEVAAQAKKRAVTIARLEALQLALSGYYAAYGMYPAVPLYGNPDPSGGGQAGEEDGAAVGGGTQASAQAAARAQPVAFEYPTPIALDDKIPLLFLPDNVISVNTAVGSLDPLDTNWDKYKGFKFGLMSFLLPRVQVVGLPGAGNAPLRDVFQKAQWMSNNISSRVPGSSNEDIQNLLESLGRQRLLENESCIRWMPCFKNILRSFRGNVLGVDVNDNSGGFHMVKRQMQSGPKVALAFSTIADGWGREFFYYSPPPYQSYKVWSAGPDGQTFPPWVPSSDNTYKKLSAHKWIKDDIEGGKLTM